MIKAAPGQPVRRLIGAEQVRLEHSALRTQVRANTLQGDLPLGPASMPDRVRLAPLSSHFPGKGVPLKNNLMQASRIAAATVWVMASVFVAGISIAASPAGQEALAGIRTSSTDPSDAPNGPQGKTDLRALIWDFGASTTTVTVSVDASTYGSGLRSALGVHSLIDADRDGLADAEVRGTRNADGMSVDMKIRLLDRTLGTADCQDLSGTATAAQSTLTSTIANALETFSFTFSPSVIPGGLSHFRWAAFGQSPEDGAAAGPWDYLPNAANPDPAA